MTIGPEPNSRIFEMSVRLGMARWTADRGPRTAGRRLQTDFGEAELTHVNLYDGTIEGIRLLDVPAGCVQYHPEAGPGPHDSVGLFDEFIREIEVASAA